MEKLQQEDPIVISKPGFTKQGDADRRHTQEYLSKNGYWGTAIKEGYETYIAWSAFFSKEEVYLFEKLMGILVPPNITGMKQYNGYTECRATTIEESFRIAKELSIAFPKNCYEYKLGLYKAYFLVGAKKGTPEGDLLKEKREPQEAAYAIKKEKQKLANTKGI